VSKTTIETRIEATPETMGALEAIVREGARKMLQAALEAEIEEHLLRFKQLVDEGGKRLVVRNGSKPERSILTGAGPIPITRPRVDDRALASMGKERKRFIKPCCKNPPRARHSAPEGTDGTREQTRTLGMHYSRVV